MKARTVFLFALLSLLWGVPYLMIKVAVAEVSVPFLVFVRCALGAAILIPFALREGGVRGLAGSWRWIVVFAVLEMAVPWGLLAHGEVHLTSSMTGLLIAATPMITLALSRFFRDREILGVRQVAGLAAGFAGVFVLAAPEIGGDVGSVLEVLAAAACYAAGSIVAARWLKDTPALPLVAACLTIVSVIYMIPGVLYRPTVVPSIEAMASIGGLAVFCTAIAFVAFFTLIRDVGAPRAVVITYIAPTVAVAAGVILLSEPLDARILCAFALVLGGSFLATVSPASGAKSPVAAADTGSDRS